MTLADIRTITAPSEAEAGERVSIQVSIKNLHNDYMGIMVGGALEYGVVPWPQITFPNNQATFPAWQYYYFDGYFTMPYYPPGKVIKIHAYSYWYGDDDAWHYDDEMVRSITTVAPEPEPEPAVIEFLDRKIISLSPVEPEPEPEPAVIEILAKKIVYLSPVPSEIELLDSKSVALIPLEFPALVELLDRKVITLIPGEEPPPLCSIDADCLPGYVCVNGKCVPEEEPEKKKFPLGALAIAGGVGLLAVGLSKDKKKITT